MLSRAVTSLAKPARNAMCFDPDLEASPHTTKKPWNWNHSSPFLTKLSTAVMSEAYERERYRLFSNPLLCVRSKLTPCLSQAKQRLPIRTPAESVSPSKRHRRHLRQCPRPRRHRFHLRDLLLLDYLRQGFRPTPRRHGQPGKQGRHFQAGRHHNSCHDSALLSLEIFILRKGHASSIRIARRQGVALYCNTRAEGGRIGTKL